MKITGDQNFVTFSTTGDPNDVPRLGKLVRHMPYVGTSKAEDGTIEIQMQTSVLFNLIDSAPTMEHLSMKKRFNTIVRRAGLPKALLLS